MKIAITSTGETLEAAVDPRFGRAKTFILYDTDTGDWSALDNTQNLQAAQGAGSQAAAAVVNAGAQAVLTGNCGPRAFTTLAAAQVTVYPGVSGTVQEAIDAFKAGELAAAGGANVNAHFGMGT